MAHSNSARKRIRQNAIRRARNRWRMRTMREALRTFNDAVAHGNAKDAQAAYTTCQKVIDRTVQKGVIHANQGARRKSRMVARLKALSKKA